MESTLSCHNYKTEYIRWLSNSNVDVFVTVSLKQARRNRHGPWTRLQYEHIQKTGWLLRDRITKAAYGNGIQSPFLVFFEGNGDCTRFHLHIGAVKPPGMSFDEYATLFRQKAYRLDWVYKQIKILPIAPGTHANVIAYNMKSGVGAFIPEASFI